MGIASGDWYGVPSCCRAVFGVQRFRHWNTVRQEVGQWKSGWDSNVWTKKQESMEIQGRNLGHYEGTIRIPKENRVRYFRSRKAASRTRNGNSFYQRNDADYLDHNL